MSLRYHRAEDLPVVVYLRLVLAVEGPAVMEIAVRAHMNEAPNETSASLMCAASVSVC